MNLSSTILVGLAAISITFAPEAFGRASVSICTKPGKSDDIDHSDVYIQKAVTAFGVQSTFNQLGSFDSSAVSAFAAYTRCINSTPFLLTVNAGFDYIESNNKINTAGRIGSGIIGTINIENSKYIERIIKTNPIIQYGLNFSIGYEDFDLSLVDSSGSISRKRGTRQSSSAQILAVYNVQRIISKANKPPALSGYRFETALTLVDRKAPSDVSLGFLDENFTIASGALEIEQFVDDPSGKSGGNKFDYRFGYQRVNSSKVIVRDIGTLRFQWRPQNSGEAYFPDKFALSASYVFGNKNFRGVNFSISKAFY